MEVAPVAASTSRVIECNSYFFVWLLFGYIKHSIDYYELVNHLSILVVTIAI